MGLPMSGGEFRSSSAAQFHKYVSDICPAPAERETRRAIRGINARLALERCGQAAKPEGARALLQRNSVNGEWWFASATVSDTGHLAHCTGVKCQAHFHIMVAFVVAWTMGAPLGVAPLCSGNSLVSGAPFWTADHDAAVRIGGEGSGVADRVFSSS
jgi:hypothetical protein